MNTLGNYITEYNAELPEYAVPCRRCLSEDVDIF